ncbi:MAG TPA: nitroreductase family deazaflavin-dependent oxidoreductase [Acidimicrobiia bacterium]|nr:nitroreductase family deazaflavin-dependent oxidoreductase [Acidimicrobiia bacterium]
MPPDTTTVIRLARTRTVDLVTIGRKSSQPQRVEIWWFYFEDRFIITGTPGRRDWYANILANPRVVIETRHGDFPASASAVPDQPFRSRFFSDGAARWYSTQAEFDALVKTAPMIELDLD